MAKEKTGVLLINLGTPDSPSVRDVRRYLREFLMDARVMDIPYIWRWMLVNLIIAPFRAPKSAKVYEQLWEERGSPLLFHGHGLKKKLQQSLGDEFLVVFGMRYQKPTITKALEELFAQNVKKIIAIPMFPQYASATTGSVMEKVEEELKKLRQEPQIKYIAQFPVDEGMIATFAELGKKYMKSMDFDHIVFSYHGLPERHIHKGSVDGHCRLDEHCCADYHSKNRWCYRAQCYLTSRKLAEKLGLSDDQYSIFFQSRLGKDPWIRPYAEEEIQRLASEGKKRILVFCPSFTADCLETTIEVGHEFKALFLEHGGEEWQLVESLNSHDRWVEALKNMVISHAFRDNDLGVKIKKFNFRNWLPE